MLIDDIKKSTFKYDGKWTEKKGVHEFSTIIAERKAFLSTKKLTYTFRIRIDDTDKLIKFSETLVEAGSGLSSGGDMDSGFGFSSSSYNTFGGNRKETIEEKSKLFGKDFSYRFNYGEISSIVKSIAESAHYKFDYQILPVK